MADDQPESSMVRTNFSSSHGKPTVIGIYGLPGSGKTTSLNELKQELGQEHFLFYDSSKIINDVVPGGLKFFKELCETDKEQWRQIAVQKVRNECLERKMVAVVAGHFMFWDEQKDSKDIAWTQSDTDTYTHILYLHVQPEEIQRRISRDNARTDRPYLSKEHADRWQKYEEDQLRTLCRDNTILFSVVASSPTLLNKVSTMLRDFRVHSEKYNTSRAKSKLDVALSTNQGQLEKMLVFDGDKTLAAEDTGVLFWEAYFKSQELGGWECPLRTLFHQSGHTYFAFRQAVLLYEETGDDNRFKSLCQEVASAVTMYPEFVSLLHFAKDQEHIGVVVITSGLRSVWEKVLERERLSKTVQVIGGGRLADGFVVTAEVKKALVTRLQENHQVHVLAFGDSVLDLPMLTKADGAVIVVGDENSRSSTMDEELMGAINKTTTFKPRQALLPSNVPPRLDISKVPQIDLTGSDFVDECELNRHLRYPEPQILDKIHKGAAELLATPMRDADVGGPALREAHRRAGYHLAVEFLPKMIGIESYPIRHVHGKPANGCRLWHERQTTIVAVMRAGEPMALGVSEAIPLAMFVHAKDPQEIKLDHLNGQVTVLLVDSVVNTGKTMVQFVERVRNLHATVRIIIVAGVTQAGNLSHEGEMTKLLTHHGNLSYVTLRCSETKFTGSGPTDTGHRLFNTTHMD